MAAVFPLMFSLVYWILFFLFLNFPSFFAVLFAAFLIWFAVTVLIIAGRDWHGHWNLWLNYLLFFVSQFGMASLMRSAVARNIYGIVFGVLGGFLVFITIQYFRRRHTFFAAPYLEFIQFVNFISLWQLLAFIYFVTIAFDFSVWNALILAAIAAFLLARGIIGVRGLKKSSSNLVLMVLPLTTAELFLFVSLLPLHYYVLASIVTLWFFFIMELVIVGQELSSRRRIFKTYLTIMVAIMILLLATATWE